jgi:hypothetical protein
VVIGDSLSGYFQKFHFEESPFRVARAARMFFAAFEIACGKCSWSDRKFPLDAGSLKAYRREWATPPQRGACYLEG